MLMQPVKPFKMYNCKSFKTAIISKYFGSWNRHLFVVFIRVTWPRYMVLGSQKVYMYYTVHIGLACQTHIILYMYMMQWVGGAVASWLVRSTLDWVVRARDLAGDIVLCSWARHLTLTVPLSTQVYKWVPANLMLGVTLWWTSIPSRGE